MEFIKHTLKNGVRLVMFPMPGVESVTAEVLIGAGSRQEDERVGGLAHFLEHMVFKGTRKYPSAQVVSSSVDAVGGYINAHTSKEFVAFYIKSRSKHISLSLDLLSDFVKAPILDTEEIEREKRVIFEEIAMYEDELSSKIHEVFEGLVFEGTDMGRPVIGTRQSVKKTKRKDFEAYMRVNYQSSWIVVSIAGSFEEQEVLKLVEKAFGDLEKGQKQAQKLGKLPTLKMRENLSKKPQVRVERKKTEQAHIILGFRGNPLGHPDRYKEMVLGSVLGGGMSSRLFTEVREKRGLAYSVKCDVEHYIDAGYITARAGIKLSGIEEAIAVILEEFRKITNAKLQMTNEELEKAKEYLKGRYALGLEDTHAVAEFYGEQELLEGKIQMLPQIVQGINSVSAEDASNLASEVFVKERLNLAVIGPYNNQEKFEKLLQ